MSKKTLARTETRPDNWWDRWGMTGLLPRLDAELWPTVATDRIRVEEFRDDGALVVRAELPGIDPDKDVELTVDDDHLCISAHRTERTEDQDKKSYRSEFRYGSFTRIIRLPAGATEDDVKASYHDGILEVRVPVDEDKQKRRTVPIART